MKFSSTTEELIRELTDFSKSKLRNPGDISFLVEIAAAHRQQDALDELQFTAKYLNGLGKILQGRLSIPSEPAAGTSMPAEEALNKIRTEFRKNILKFSENLKDYVDKASGSEAEGFKDKYLSLSQSSMMQLTSLIYDLSWLKMFNNARRGK